MPCRKHAPFLILLLSLMVVLAACVESTAEDATDDAVAAEPDADSPEQASANETTEATPTTEIEEPKATLEPAPDDPSDTADRPDRDEDRLPYWHRWWENTDFDNHTVPLD
jgi:hypothetical protein